MARDSCIEALVLGVRGIGEQNRLATVFGRNRGIFKATLYGGPKSRLRSLVSLWNRGRMWLYEEPARDGGLPRIKISDFEVASYHESFRTDLLSFWQASLAAELAAATRCAGESEACWILLNGFLDGMEFCRTEFERRTGLLRFLWRYLGLLGVRPDAERCVRCQRGFSALKLGQNNVSSTGFSCGGFSYSRAERGFVCGECAAQAGGGFPVSEAALRYLAAAGSLPPAEARSLALDEGSALELKELLFFLSQQAAEGRLSALESGAGIL